MSAHVTVKQAAPRDPQQAARILRVPAVTLLGLRRLNPGHLTATLTTIPKGHPLMRLFSTVKPQKGSAFSHYTLSKAVAMA